jgi:type IV pilus assembly protein PilB
MAEKKDFVEKLANILVKQGSISQKESEDMKKDFYNRSKEAFDFFLLDEGLVPKEDVLKALSTYYQVPAVDVVGLFFDHDLLKNFPKDFLIDNVVIPFEVDQEILIVIANDPSDPNLLDKIESLITYTVEFQVGLKQDILDSIREYYDEPPEGYIHDLSDEDELEDKEAQDGVIVDELSDKEGW